MMGGELSRRESEGESGATVVVDLPTRAPAANGTVSDPETLGGG